MVGLLRHKAAFNLNEASLLTESQSGLGTSLGCFRLLQVSYQEPEGQRIAAREIIGNGTKLGMICTSILRAENKFKNREARSQGSPDVS